LGSSAITVDNNLMLQNGASLTVNAGTSSLTISDGNHVNFGSQAFNDVTINTSGNIDMYGQNSFNDVVISNSQEISFEGGNSQTMNSLSIVNGTGCDDFTYLKSSTGTPAELIVSSGIINGDYLDIVNIKASGGATFNATNTVSAGDVTGWNITPYAGQDLYWIGGSGDWTDPAHWSTTSGGSSFGCVPTIADNVIFDANSFSAPGQEVSMSGEQYCKDLDMSAVTNNPTFKRFGTLTVNGSLLFSANMDFDFSGSLIFIADDADNTITTNGIGLICAVEFQHSGEYTLGDDFHVSNPVDFISGTFSTNNFDIYNTGGTGKITFETSSAKTFNLGSSDIYTDALKVKDASGITMNSGTSGIHLSSQCWHFESAGVNLNDVYVSLQQWTSGINSYGDHNINNIIIEPGAGLILKAGSTLNTATLDASGSPGNYIVLESSNNGTATINVTGGDFCGDFLKIQNMNATGATFYAGTNSINLGGNTGWIFSGVAAIDQFIGLCEDNPGTGTYAGYDLTTLDNSVNNGSGNPVVWYNDAGLSTPISIPANLTVTDGQIVYAEVSSGTCTNDAEVSFTVHSLPVFSLGNDTSIATTDTIVIGPATDFVNYVWNSGDTTKQITLDGSVLA